MRTTIERIADTYFPLIRRTLLEVLGVFGKQLASRLGQNYNRRPSSALVNLMRDRHETGLEKLPAEYRDVAARKASAFKSPSYRRRFRWQKWEVLLPELRDWRLLIHEFVDGSKIETSPGVITTSREVMVEQMLGAIDELTTSPEVVSRLLPFNKVVPARYRKCILAEVGEEGYITEVLGVNWEIMADYIIAGIEIRVKGMEQWRSLAKIAGLDPDEVATRLGHCQDDVQRLAAFIKLLLGSLRTAQGELDQDKIMRLSYWIVGTLLIPRVLGTKSAGLYGRKREVSSETSIGEGITLGETLGDARSGNEIAHTESRIDLEILQQDLPAAQRRSVEVYLEHERTGTSIKDICDRDGEDYEAIRQAFQRVKARYQR